MTAVIAVSGVRSSCDMSATNRRLCASRALSSSTWLCSASAVRLNVLAKSESSSAPLTSSRVSSRPSPNLFAASASWRTGRSTGRRGGLGQQGGRDQREQRGDRQRPAQGVEIGPLVVQGLEHVGRQAGRHDLGPAHHERLAADVHPLPVQVVREVVSGADRSGLGDRRHQGRRHLVDGEAREWRRTRSSAGPGPPRPRCSSARRSPRPRRTGRGRRSSRRAAGRTLRVSEPRKSVSACPGRA